MTNTDVKPRFKEKVALVTGAAQGIGRATALLLAHEGARVAIVDRAETPARDVQSEIEALNGAATVIVADLEKAGGASAMVEAVLSHWGRLDVSVHNVGGTIWAKPLWEYSVEQIELEIQRSLWPTLWCCHAVLPVMRRQQSGVVVNVGSVATRGIWRAPYAAAKGAVHALTAALSLDLSDCGVRINCVAPGGIEAFDRPTPRNPQPPTAQEKRWMQEVLEQTVQDTPMRRLGRPGEIADAIVFLASEQASYITGQTLFVAGGGIG